MYCRALIETGKVSMADSLLNNIRGGEFDLKSQLRSKIALGRNDYGTALRELNLTDSLISEKFSASMNQNLGMASEDYNGLLKKLHEAEIENARLIFWICIVILVMVLGVLGVFIQKYRVQKRELRLSTREWMDNVHEIETEASLEGDPQKEIIKKIFNSHTGSLKTLGEIYALSQKNSTDPKISEKISKGVENFIKDTSKLEEEINIVLDNIMEDFRRDLPDQPDKNYELMLYSLMGMTTNAIKAFFHEDRSQIYSRRHRLKDKIKELPPEKRDRYLPLVR